MTPKQIRHAMKHKKMVLHNALLQTRANSPADMGEY